MEMRILSKIGHQSSKTLFEIGNSLNTTIGTRPNKHNSIKIITNDREALRNDWLTVGREVKIAIDRFGKENGLDERT